MKNKYWSNKWNGNKKQKAVGVIQRKRKYKTKQNTIDNTKYRNIITKFTIEQWNQRIFSHMNAGPPHLFPTSTEFTVFCSICFAFLLLFGILSLYYTLGKNQCENVSTNLVLVKKLFLKEKFSWLILFLVAFVISSICSSFSELIKYFCGYYTLFPQKIFLYLYLFNDFFPFSSKIDWWYLPTVIVNDCCFIFNIYFTSLLYWHTFNWMSVPSYPTDIHFI